MNYYEVCIVKSPLKPLTYIYDQALETGQEVQVPLGFRKELQTAVVVAKVNKPAYICKPIKHITKRYYDNTMLKCAKFISDYYVCSLGEAVGLFGLYDKHMSYEPVSKSYENIDQLTTDQNKAYKFVEKNHISLLFGDTGSGKTVLYLKAIAQTLEQNLQAVFLIPEISLTPQMYHRVQAVFGEHVAIWHSKINKKQKLQTITNIQTGATKVVLGARSALFLPYVKLGLIVVDEEHDMSYKADKKPRYNAKDIAIYMASKFDIKLILGSATPSISSFVKIPHYRLNQKYFDTTNKIVLTKSTNIYDDIFIHKIEQNFKASGQIIVYVPTRANFKYQVCDNCGKAVECAYCSVSMSLYSNLKALRCHYCGWSEKIPDICPSCKVGHITNNIVGTAEVAQQLQTRYPDKIIKQFDRDKIKTNTQLEKILKEFNEKKIDILVGTSMISKGHDYHNVNLVIILGLDSILNMDSYTARQMAITMAIQVAGRAGRKTQGDVVISTKNYEFFDYYLNQNDYKEFLTHELQFRKELYPPKIRLAKVVCRHKTQTKARQLMDILTTRLKENKHKDIQIVKADICKIAKISNHYRYELVIRSKDTNLLLNFLHTIAGSGYAIDMDSTI
jgi:primosomal protein N' (replication factor Y)